VYEVHFPDGQMKALATNAIAEAVHTQCDKDGNEYILLDVIVDYQKDASMVVAWNDHVNIVNGKKIVAHSSQCWESCHE
jgi:DUF917 family protein